MVNYLCKNCKYRFTPKTKKMPLICPYCSKQGTLEQEKDASTILREASEI